MTPPCCWLSGAAYMSGHSSAAVLHSGHLRQGTTDCVASAGSLALSLCSDAEVLLLSSLRCVACSMCSHQHSTARQVGLKVVLCTELGRCAVNC